MANSNGTLYDYPVVLYRSLASGLTGIAIGAGLARDFPSVGRSLQFLGLLSALVFMVLAQSRSKKLEESKHS